MVRLQAGTTDAAAAGLFKRLGLVQVGRVDQLGTRVVIGRGKSPAALKNALSAEPAVAEVEVDGEAALTLTPNDPLWVNQWFARRVRAPQAWDTTIGAGGPVVAVLDTGVQFSHPDLVGRLVGGYDFVNNDSNPTDDNGHGTAVSGVVAAAANNGLGVAGMCWRCQIMPLKVANSHGNVRWSNVAAAIVWAADRRVKAINMSFGGYTGSSTVADAILYARNRGVVVVGAAGNDGRTAKFYPASYPGVLSVAATTSEDNLYSWSNRGSWVDVAAPGCTWTTRRGSTWSSFCGTSAAAPIVAAIAALYRASHTGETRADTEFAIKSTAVRVTSAIGGGRVDAAAAVELRQPVDEVPDSGIDPEPTLPPEPEPAPTVGPCPNVDSDDDGGRLAWSGQLDSSRTFVACTVRLEGRTRVAMQWNAPDRARFRLRDEDSDTVMQLFGLGDDEDRVERWLPQGTYKLIVKLIDGGTAAFDVRLVWGD